MAPACISYKVVNCSVFQTSKSLAQVSTHSKFLGLMRQSLLCSCQERQQCSVVIWKSHAFRKLWEQLKWENMFLLNWLTWETKSYGIPKKLGTEGWLGRVWESFLSISDQKGPKPILWISLVQCQNTTHIKSSDFSWKKDSLFCQKIRGTLRKGLLSKLCSPGVQVTCLFISDCPAFSPR